jgi:pimeloyl-ACP methyl ester carboxylesterase
MPTHPPIARKPGLKRLRTMFICLTLLALTLYLLLIAALAWGQERLLFQPQKLPADHRFETAADVHEVNVDVPGARLNALHLRLPHPDGVVFFLHGNGGSLANWFVNVDYYRRLNLDLFMIDYRGYGKSTGHIASQAELQADVRAAWDSIAPRYAGLRRVIYGRSLGTGLAAALAADVQPELTVLVSPYFSMQNLAQQHYPWVPSAVLRYPLRTDEALPRIRGPVLLAHGGHDTLIPADNSLRLLTLQPHARLLLVPQAAHNDMQNFPLYLNGLAAALKQP